VKFTGLVSVLLSAAILIAVLSGCSEVDYIIDLPSFETECTAPPLSDIPSTDSVEDDAHIVPSEDDTESDDSPVAALPQTATVTFAGDVLVDRGTKNVYASQGFFGLIDENDNVRGSADIFMVNLEQPFSTRGEPMEDKQWAFRGDPRHISFLTELGVDIVSLANNHTLDYGTYAFLDTLKLLKENDIAFVGGGVNLEEASSYKIYEVNGIKIAFLAASNVLPSVSWYATNNRAGLFATYDPRQLIAKINEASAVADHVVVYVHWGVEREVIPEEWQRTKAKQFIDAGASCVIGAHPHVLQGIEYYMGKPIIYSLGDFIFPTNNKDTMTVSITFGDEISVSIRPYVIRSLKTVPAVEERDRTRILKHLRDVSFNVRINDDFTVHSLEDLPVSAQIRRMSLEEKVGQMFMCAYDADMVDMVKDYHLGGVILFSSDIQTETQTRKLISDLQEASRFPLFIAVDEEGGIVSRLGALGGERLPNAAQVGRSGDFSRAFERGVTIAKRLKDLGFNVNFAPVADINTNSRNTVIGSRAFSPDSKIAGGMVSEFVKGLQGEGIAATLKHFPGHGDTNEDSHYGLATVIHDINRLNEREFVPFQMGIDAGAAFVMIGHISAPNVTGNDEPATFSKKIVTELLREQLKFDGIIVTDALNMGAITKYYSPGETAVKAVLAGADILLMPHDLILAYNAVIEAVRGGVIYESRIDESVLRILEMKERLGVLP
jgi:beta-N-acetylhexosaminidase